MERILVESRFTSPRRVSQTRTPSSKSLASRRSRSPKRAMKSRTKSASLFRPPISIPKTEKPRRSLGIRSGGTWATQGFASLRPLK